MRRIMQVSLTTIAVALVVAAFPATPQSQKLKENKDLDKKVRKFLNEHAGRWHDLNIPSSDGNILYDLVIKNHYTSALEIGTSTGHSAIWIAWALSKTGGKLITIEINKSRYEQALVNFKEAGLSEYIDARLADAHELVKNLPGPFDFIFSDADKEWYRQYFVDLDPKLSIDGCFTAHNVTDPRRTSRYDRRGEMYEYATFVQSLPNYETTYNESGSGLSISYKRSER
jgi:predicted O-methyltransferase YrrM